MKAIGGVYFIFTIPLFISPFDLPPRAYIPEEWYNAENIDKAYKVNLPYSFELKETEDLSIAAFNLKQTANYEKAILVYRQALKLEPQNPKLYFDLSDCYAKNINLDKAISLLDTAITLDSSSAPFYNNRGLYHYQLNENYQAIKDYRIAIKLDSTSGMFYANLAMVLHKEDLYPEACACIRKAEELKFDIKTSWRLKMIKKYCHQQNL